MVRGLMESAVAGPKHLKSLLLQTCLAGRIFKIEIPYADHLERIRRTPLEGIPETRYREGKMLVADPMTQST